MIQYIFFINFFVSSTEIDQFLQFHHSKSSIMIFKTHKAFNAPRKRHSTIKTRENNEKTSKPPAKHIKSKGFIHSNKMSKESTPESRSSTLEVIEQSLDISDLQYTVI